MNEPITDLNQLPILMTVDDVRHVLGVARQKAYALTHRDDFPALRLGRSIRIPKDAFLRWIAAQASNGLY